MFNDPAYIVFDIEGAMKEKIQLLRKKYDPQRASLHVEISLSGSCGLGAINSQEDPQKVFKTIDKISTQITPFYNSFKEIKNFKDTGIYYFSVKNKQPFIKSYELLKNSGIKFNPCFYPFEPHCTIKLGTEHSSTDQKLKKIKPPQEKFLLEFLSVYSKKSDQEYKLLHKRHLGV